MQRSHEYVGLRVYINIRLK